MKNCLFLDLETSSLSVDHGAVLELAAIAYMDGEVKDSILLKMRPHADAHMDPKAFEITGFSISEVKTWEDPVVQIQKLIDFVDSFDCKFRIAGHNVNFDSKFLFKLFCRYGFYGEYNSRFRSDNICTLEMAKSLDLKKNKKTESNSLGDLCKAFDIELTKAHSAMPDIEATVKLYEKLSSMMPNIQREKFNGDYQKQRRYFLDRSFVIFNPEGDIFIQEKATKDPEALRFILGEIWDLYC